ncbi:hypothetical protein CBOM_05895 [Ceraceosorus bombacis]|uniref:Uncharacterized protein n=1 Tax=Ceraceosorus bombacis TaxID=401625 RepID=A0A0P1BII4_9BASI|nr:hypothetical protein CBOM_05895 [Ceraceosorus bombacis]
MAKSALEYIEDYPGVTQVKAKDGFKGGNRLQPKTHFKAKLIVEGDRRYVFRDKQNRLIHRIPMAKGHSFFSKSRLYSEDVFHGVDRHNEARTSVQVTAFPRIADSTHLDEEALPTSVEAAIDRKKELTGLALKRLKSAPDATKQKRNPLRAEERQLGYKEAFRKRFDPNKRTFQLETPRDPVFHRQLLRVNAILEEKRASTEELGKAASQQPAMTGETSASTGETTPRLELLQPERPRGKGGRFIAKSSEASEVVGDKGSASTGGKSTNIHVWQPDISQGKRGGFIAKSSGTPKRRKLDGADDSRRQRKTRTRRTPTDGAAPAHVGSGSWRQVPAAHDIRLWTSSDHHGHASAGEMKRASMTAQGQGPPATLERVSHSSDVAASPNHESNPVISSPSPQSSYRPVITWHTASPTHSDANNAHAAASPPLADDFHFPHFVGDYDADLAAWLHSPSASPKSHGHAAHADPVSSSHASAAIKAATSHKQIVPETAQHEPDPASTAYHHFSPLDDQFEPDELTHLLRSPPRASLLPQDHHGLANDNHRMHRRSVQVKSVMKKRSRRELRESPARLQKRVIIDFHTISKPEPQWALAHSIKKHFEEFHGGQEPNLVIVQHNFSPSVDPKHPERPLCLVTAYTAEGARTLDNCPIAAHQPAVMPNEHVVHLSDKFYHTYINEVRQGFRIKEIAPPTRPRKAGYGRLVQTNYLDEDGFIKPEHVGKKIIKPRPARGPWTREAMMSRQMPGNPPTAQARPPRPATPLGDFGGKRRRFRPPGGLGSQTSIGAATEIARTEIDNAARGASKKDASSSRESVSKQNIAQESATARKVTAPLQGGAFPSGKRPAEVSVETLRTASTRSVQPMRNRPPPGTSPISSFSEGGEVARAQVQHAGTHDPTDLTLVKNRPDKYAWKDVHGLSHKSSSSRPVSPQTVASSATLDRYTWKDLHDLLHDDSPPFSPHQTSVQPTSAPFAPANAKRHAEHSTQSQTQAHHSSAAADCDAAMSLHKTTGAGSAGEGGLLDVVQECAHRHGKS